MYKKFLLKFETSVINIILFIFIAFNIVSCSSDLNTKSSNDTETETAMSTFDKNIDLNIEHIQYNRYNTRALQITVRYNFNMMNSWYLGKGAGTEERRRMK